MSGDDKDLGGHGGVQGEARPDKDVVTDKITWPKAHEPVLSKKARGSSENSEQMAPATK